MVGDWPTSSPDRLAVSIQSQTSVTRPQLGKSNCITSNWIILTILTLLQGSYYAFRQARGLRRLILRLLAMHLNIRFSMETFSFLPLAPRAYVTYYPARGLSGHTSPCGELACFWQTLLCRKVKWAHFIAKEIFFLKEHLAFFEQPASSMLMLVNWFSRLVKISLQLFKRLSWLSKMSSLAGRRSSRRRVAS